MTSILSFRTVDSGYGDALVLEQVSLEVNPGEIVALVGSNGAGKSTTINVASGIIPAWRGDIMFNDRRINRFAPHDIVDLGLVQVPEGRRIFPSLTVLENLQLGAYLPKARSDRKSAMEMVFHLFPRLEERQNQHGSTLSGGEQQMLAIGRALMTKPKMLMLDEPSLGLAPQLVRALLQIVKEINRQGVTILLVEQNVRAALRVAHRAYILETGRIVLQGVAHELLDHPMVRRAYLGL